MSSWPTKDTDIRMANALQLSFCKKRALETRFVTISREFGCDAIPLANAIKEKLNAKDREHPWHIFDREALLQAADPSDLDDDTVSIFEEYGHSEFMGYLQEAIFGQKAQQTVLKNMAKVIRMLARRGHVIMVGRGAGALTQDIDHGFHVRLYATEAWRIDNYASKHKVSSDEARKFVVDNQSKREGFLKTYLADDIANPNLYNMMINNARFSSKKASEIICAAL